MARRSKEDYEKIFNEILGTDIRWSRLPKEDLLQLAFLFDNPEVLMRKLQQLMPDEEDLGTKHDEFPLARQVFRTITERRDGPIARAAKAVLGDE